MPDEPYKGFTSEEIKALQGARLDGEPADAEQLVEFFENLSGELNDMPPEPEAPPDEIEPVTTIPPQDKEAEEAVCGSVLIDPECYPDLATILNPSDFKTIKNGWIWAAFGNLTGRGEPIDTLTVADELKRMGQLEEIGGDAYLTGLLNAVPTSLNAKTYAEKVKDCAVKRNLIAAANEIATLAFNPRMTADKISSRALEAIQESTDGAGQDIVLRTMADSFEPHPPRSWVIENLILEKTLTILYADAGSKKTYIGLHMAAAIASGSNWLAYTTHQAPVLYFDEENGSDEIDERLAAIARGMGCNQDIPLYHVSYAGLMLDNPEDCLKVKMLIERTGAKFVEFDSLQDIMVGDENSKQDTQPIFTAMKRMTDSTGAAFLVQHHTGKNKDYRGSTAIKGNVHLMIEVISSDDSGLITFKSKKNRRGAPVKFTAEAIWNVDKFTMKPAIKGAVARPFTPAEQEVIQFVTEHPDCTIDDVQKNASACSPSTARKAVYALANEKVFKRTNPGEKVATYSKACVTVTDV